MRKCEGSAWFFAQRARCSSPETLLDNTGALFPVPRPVFDTTSFPYQSHHVCDKIQLWSPLEIMRGREDQHRSYFKGLSPAHLNAHCFYFRTIDFPIENLL